MEPVRGCRTLCFLIIFTTHFAECRGVWWTAGGPLMLQPRRICRKVHAVGGELQKSICRRDRHLLKEIVKGVEIGMDECQFQLRFHRWNCTTRRRSLGKMLLRGCGDNFDFGYQKSLEFMDFGGSEPAKDVRAKILRHNNEVGRLAIKNQISVKCKCHGLSASCELKTCWPKMAPFRQTGDVLLHKFKAAKPVTPDNSPAGSFLWLEEMAASSYRERKASSNVQRRNGSSRNQQPVTPPQGNFDSSRPAADSPDTSLSSSSASSSSTSHLQRRSTAAVQEEVLVYTDTSPNLCKTNRKMGIWGTRGRTCNGTTSSESSGSCEYLCCGRGYVAEVATVETNCRCRFQWCCEVICERCAVNKSSHYCS